MTARAQSVFVVFEGLDGCGKTSCARATAHALGADFETTPSLRIRAYRDEILASYGRSPEPAHMFYWSTLLAASEAVRNARRAGRSVVLDRYFLSTQAYAVTRGSRLELDALGAQLLAPDLTVLLDAPLDVRRARIVARGGASAADRETLDPAFDKRVRAEHTLRSALPVVGRLLPIDTATTSIEDVVAQVVAVARGLVR